MGILFANDILDEHRTLFIHGLSYFLNPFIRDSRSRLEHELAALLIVGRKNCFTLYIRFVTLIL